MLPRDITEVLQALKVSRKSVDQLMIAGYFGAAKKSEIIMAIWGNPRHVPCLVKSMIRDVFLVRVIGGKEVAAQDRNHFSYVENRAESNAKSTNCVHVTYYLRIRGNG